MSSEQPSTSGNQWLSYAAVGTFLFLVAWRTTESIYALRDLAGIAALYALLAMGLVTGARAVAPTGRASRLGAALLVGTILAWHLREQTRIEGVGATLWTAQGLAEFLPFALGFAVVFWILEAFARRGRPADTAVSKKTLIVCLATTATFFLALGLAFFASNTMRWHLVRHNQMIGTLAFHMFGTPVGDIEAEHWAAHRRGAPLGQPAWVHELYEATIDRGTTPRGGDPPISPTEPATDAGPPPDIVFVMLDTLRADGQQAYGGPAGSMPQLNRIAADATVFTDVIANAPWTQPSIASFFTGVLPEEHGVISYPFRMSANVLTLAELLQASGYETKALFANAVIANLDSGFGRGFGSFEFLQDDELTYARADAVTDATLAWIEENVEPDAAGRRAPVFLYVHYFDPHVPYLSSNLSDPTNASPSIDEARRYYADELQFLDSEVARLLDGVGDAFAGPRVVFVTSDHGEEFGEHDGLGHSQTLYSEVLRIPAFLQLNETAASTPNGRIDARLEGRDFFDLLLRLGIGEPVDVAAWANTTDRNQRVASLYFEKDPGRSAFVHALLRPYRDRIYSRMIQSDGWRYIWSAFGRTDELYNLTVDPAERRNLARQHPDRIATLRAELDALPPYWAQLVPLQLSAEALESLRQLGYIR